MAVTAEDIVQFWFEPTSSAHWFARNDAFDAKICERYADTYRAACAGELWHWRKTPQGRLAEVIVLDQFSRNLHRNSPLAFAMDGMALALAQEAIDRDDDEKLEMMQRRFLYMPFMHSESAAMHEIAVQLFSDIGDENTLKYEKLHKKIIDLFGRYPHRNEVMGRETTKEEAVFLEEPNSAF